METNNEDNIDPLAENLALASLNEELERAFMEERAPSPTTSELPSPIRSDETKEQGRTRRKTMAARTQQGQATSSNTTPDLNHEQMREIVTALSGGTRMPKAKEPEFY